VRYIIRKGGIFHVIQAVLPAVDYRKYLTTGIHRKIICRKKIITTNNQDQINLLTAAGMSKTGISKLWECKFTERYASSYRSLILNSKNVVKCKKLIQHIP